MWAYQSFKLSEIAVAPELYTAKPVLAISSFTPDGSNYAITMKLTVGGDEIAMVALNVANKIRVGTEPDVINTVPEIVSVPNADGTSLTFTVKFPIANRGFLRVVL